ncbi:hypothetical protein [Microterricola viridarii]|uniref:hypothetical protein n=1 Tax=Microterricola viridarii TaxID=412690 RepID=UPI00101ADB76|nr:hypothetical protein [Microterricola viridarii]
MTNTQSSVRPTTDVRRAWTIGGALLIAATLFSLAWWPVLLPGEAIGPISTAAHALALLIFTFGLGGTGSVTARRPLGTAALAAFAVLLVASQLFWSTLGTGNDLAGLWMELRLVDSFVQFVVAAIAVILIARAGVVPQPWNWAPGWVLAALAAVWLLSQLIRVNIGAGRGPNPDAQTIALMLSSLDTLLRAVGPVFLGVIAIVLGDRSARTVVSESR